MPHARHGSVVPAMELAYIPSPSRGVLYLGPIPLRGYAFCIIIGVFVAVWLGNKRWIARGGRPGTVADIAVWAVPFGLVGGRLYHVITDYELYFSDGRDWVDAFKVWQGGLGIWGAIALGAVGAWIGCRRRGIPLPAYADALAPGIAVAQAIGRWGNWFNQELYGRPTDLPWALHITSSTDGRVPGYYHPTFLYESLWCVGVGFLVIWADRRFKLGHGRAFALYVAAYCVGRGWVEYMRVDDAHHILGLRLNDWTAMLVFLLAVTYIVVSFRKRPGREEIVEPGAFDGDVVRDDGSVGPEKKAEPEPEPKDEKPTAEDEKPAATEAATEAAAAAAPKAPKAPKVPRASEAPEAPEAPEVPEASEALEAVEALEAAGTAEASKDEAKPAKKG
jgi:prolipoprotein diacylglyceryl transferase